MHHLPKFSLIETIGSHTQFSGNITDTLLTSIKYGMYSVQFFLGNPQSTTRTKISDSDIEKSKKICQKFPMNVYSHFPYISNLAGSVSCLAWNGNEEQDEKTMAVIKSIEYELSILANFEKNGVVIHPGNFKDRDTGLKTISKSINKINFPPNSKLILENSAGQGCSLATTFTEIKTIIDNIDDEKKKHIGVCIDTCHIFAYGDYDISKKSEIDRMFVDFDTIIGRKYLSLIHFNDSLECLGSKKDRHQLIGDGKIFLDNSIVSYFIELSKKSKIPMILETDITDMIKFIQ